MNLMKLFNINYFIQNVKKSKNILVLAIILMPILSAVVLMMVGNNTYDTVVGNEITIVNTLGMYVIPIVISMCLFGYVFKRNSVDFINSMPLSRKTIFVTNTIGGIILIAITQLLALILMFLITLLMPNIIIFNMVLIEMFFMMLISYIFVFVVANLAMTISGNYLTQLAVTLLILFLIPFSIDSLNAFSNVQKIKLENSSYSFEVARKMNTNYTTPYGTISNILNGSDYKILESKVLGKTAILSVIYIAIGIILFEKRKMENTEESFANIYIHLLVKILTLVPFIVIITLIDAELPLFIFEIVLVTAYYFIYDILTKRKVKFLISAGSLIVSLIVLLFTFGIIKDRKENSIYTLKLDEIEKVSLDNVIDTIVYSNKEIYISDKDLIKYIYDNIDKNTHWGYRYTNSSVKYVVSHEYDDNIYCNFKLKNGDEIILGLRLDKEKREIIKNKLMNSEAYKKELREMCTLPSDAVYDWKNNIIDKDTSKILENELKNIGNIENPLNYKSNSDFGRYDFSVCVYRNHCINQIYIPIDLNEDIFKTITKMSNNRAYDIIQRKDNYTTNLPYNIAGRLTQNLNLNFDEENMYYNAIRQYCQKEINNFIEKYHDESCDLNKEYYIINAYFSRDYDLVFFTNRIDEINEIVKKAVEEHKEELKEYNYYIYEYAE